MTALSDNRATDSRNEGNKIGYPVAASTTIYAGSIVMIDEAGYARPAASRAGLCGAVGVAVAKVDNSSGSAGDLDVQVQSGEFKFAGTTLSQADVGKVVYAEDDQTIDNTRGVNEATAGILTEYVSASVGWIGIGPEYVPPVGTGMVQYAEVSLTSAEILALYTTAKTLVGAPGAGYVTEFLSAVLVLDHGGTNYATNGNLSIRETNAAGTALSDTVAEGDFLFAAADAIRCVQALSADVALLANKALVLSCATGDPATGDGTLTAKVAYRVHATGL